MLTVRGCLHYDVIHSDHTATYRRLCEHGTFGEVPHGQDVVIAVVNDGETVLTDARSMSPGHRKSRGEYYV